MKKVTSLFVMALLVTQIVAAVSVGTGITPEIETEDFPPHVWLCDNRIVYDDFTEPGRFEDWQSECAAECLLKHPEDPEEREECIEDCRRELLERINNYAFEGEQIKWTVLVMDKNGVEKLEDVFATIGDVQGEGNDIEVNCQEIGPRNLRIEESCTDGRCIPRIPEECNARILEEQLEYYDKDTMQYYECTFTVETPESMYGEYWITVEATDLDGLSGVMAENEYWFLNPVVALSIDGDMMFEEVRPGTDSYSSTMLVGNDADEGSGVLMDMFISGTDFYDSASSGAMCPTTNQLALENFRYYAVNGAYNTYQDDRSDQEGYVGINYGIGFNNPDEFYDVYEIMQVQEQSPYYAANILAPGAEMAITFKLSLPEPCNGDFDTGSIYFWGEAI
jgi:hypothetical protein